MDIYWDNAASAVLYVRTHVTAFVILSAAASLALTLSLLFLAVAQAPGWRHYRTFAAVALVACACPVVGIHILDANGSRQPSDLSAAISLALAFASGILWLRFDREQERRELSVYERLTSALLGLAILLCLIPGVIHTDGSVPWVASPRPGNPVAALETLVAIFFVGLLWTCMGQLVVRHIFRLRAGGRGRRGSILRLGSVLLFAMGAVATTLSTNRAPSWIFLAPVGLSIGVVLMALDVAWQTTKIARELADSNIDLESRISLRTEDLVVARTALITAERQTALGHLAAGVGHEVNNPLSYVKGNLDFLQHQIQNETSRGKDEAALAAIDDALHGVERIRKVVNNLAIYARSTPVVGAAHVGRAIDVALRVVRPQSKFIMNIAIDSPENWAVAIDESKLVQVLVNVLMNAAAASRDRLPTPTTTISTTAHGDTITIAIVDRGFGMSEETRSRVFDPTHREDRVYADSGLGLYLCRSIVEAAGGTIALKSTQNIGSTIEIQLRCSKRDLANISGIPTPVRTENQSHLYNEGNR